MATPASPYTVAFTVDASLLTGLTPGDLQVFRNGAVLGDCTDPVAAVPDPCVVSRAAATGGDALITVRTSHFSTWNVGRLSYRLTVPFQPVDSLPTVNTTKAGAGVPVKFALGGDRGLDVFATGYPASTAVACSSAAPDEIEQTAGSSVIPLIYDAHTGQYTYTWKTAKSWTGCRDLVLRLRDGQVLKARFLPR